MRSLVYTVSKYGIDYMTTFSYNMAQKARSEGYTIKTSFVERREPRSTKEKEYMARRFKLLAEAR